MKIIISHDEALAVIRSHLQLNDNIEIELGFPIASAGDAWKEEEFSINHPHYSLIHYIDTRLKGGDISNKINAIKEFRAQSSCGLKEAKDIIEDWPNQRKRIIQTGWLLKQFPC